MMGQISLFPYTFAPAGWIFYLLRTRFGGDGESTFALPNLSAAAPANTHFAIALSGILRPNSYEGIVGETLLSLETPSAENLMECNGQSLTKNKYPMLENYMGTRFGGDGGHYNLPDLRPKAPNGFHYVMTMLGDDPQFPRMRSPYVGELLLLPYELNSQALLLCNSSRLPVQQHPALYSLIGNTFGGDTTSFALPDLRSAAPAKFNYYLSSGGVFPNRP
jgi:microcystin-dependent protein